MGMSMNKPIKTIDMKKSTENAYGVEQAHQKKRRNEQKPSNGGSDVKEGKNWNGSGK